MPPPAPAPDQLARLVDAAAVRDLVTEFARCVDDKDAAGYAATFSEDAVLVLPFGRVEGRAAIAAMKGPPAHWGTTHQLGQVLVELDGDAARARTWLTATHVFDTSDTTQKAHSGGWYRQELVRTPDGWRFSSVELCVVWADARPMVPGGPPAGFARAHP